MKFLSKTNIFLNIIIITGSFLRLYDITAVSLWHDEAFSALLIRYPYNEIIARIILDVHPPLYYILLRIWDIILGDSLLSLRLFSAFFGILTVYFTYLFVKTAFKNERLALISAAFIAVNPFQIQYATEARMYTLGTFLIMLSSWLLVKAIDSQNAPKKENLKNACEASLEKCDWLGALSDEKKSAKSKLAKLSIKIKKYRWLDIITRYKWWILYGISAALAIYTHYYLIFSVAAQALFIIFLVLKNYGLRFKWWSKSENIRGAAVAYIISFVIFLPWLPILLKQMGQVEENYWIPKMSASSIPNTLWRMLSGSNIDFSSNQNIHYVMISIVSIIFLAVLAIVIKRETSKYRCLVIFSFFVPFLLAIGLSFKRSLYLDRYFVFAGIFYIIIFSLFTNSLYNNLNKNLRTKRIQSAFFLFFVLMSIGLFIQNWRFISPAGKPGMAGASEYLFKNAKPDEKVYVNSSFIFFTYKYYAYRNYFSTGYPSNFNPSQMIETDNVFADTRIYPEYLTPLLYTPGLAKLSDIPHFSGTALLTDHDLLTDFNKNTKLGENIWLVWTTGFGSSKPEVPKNWKQMDEAGFQDVFGYRGWITVTEYRVQ